MTNKIAIAIIVSLVMVIIIPISYAELNPTEQKWYEICNKKEINEKYEFADFSCAVDIYQMYYDIISLLGITSDLQQSYNVLQQENNNLQQRLDVLEGKIPPPYTDLTVNVYPKIVNRGESFSLVGTADRLEQFWVDYTFFNPNGEEIQHGHTEIVYSNVYDSHKFTPNIKWNTSGNYTVQVTHGTHVQNATIQFSMNENP